MTPGRYSLEYAYDRRSGVRRPILPVRIARGDVSRGTFGLVDSGADGSLFHVTVAESLGLTLDPGAAVTTQGTAGATETWFADVSLIVAGGRFQARVGFVTNPRLARFGVLGRADFFRAFRVAFDERAERLYLDPYSEDE